MSARRRSARVLATVVGLSGLVSLTALTILLAPSTAHGAFPGRPGLIA